jgi:hypothetical protein
LVVEVWTESAGNWRNVLRGWQILEVSVGPGQLYLVRGIAGTSVGGVHVDEERVAARDDARVLYTGGVDVAVDGHGFAGGVGVEGAQGEDARGDDDDAGETSER